MEKALRRVLTILFCLLPVIAQAQDKFFDSAGVSIRYIDRGSGEPIVLLHGFTSNIERGWIENGVLDKLARDHRVVALDLRGHGKSGKPHEPSQYGKESCQDLIRLLDHLAIQRAHMVGYSYGSVIVAKLLTTNPERFVTATIGGSGGLRNWSEQDEREYGEMASELEQGMPYRSLIRQLWPSQGPPSPEMERRLPQQILAQNDPVAHAALLRRIRGRR